MKAGSLSYDIILLYINKRNKNCYSSIKNSVSEWPECIDEKSLKNNKKLGHCPFASLHSFKEKKSKQNIDIDYIQR